MELAINTILNNSKNEKKTLHIINTLTSLMHEDDFTIVANEILTNLKKYKSFEIEKELYEIISKRNALQLQEKLNNTHLKYPQVLLDIIPNIRHYDTHIKDDNVHYEIIFDNTKIVILKKQKVWHFYFNLHHFDSTYSSDDKRLIIKNCMKDVQIYVKSNVFIKFFIKIMTDNKCCYKELKI